MSDRRWGLTIPVSDLPLREQVARFQEAEDLGYTDLWSSEVNLTDAFTPLALAASVTRRATLGTAIVNVYTRTPAVLAMQAAALNELAPGRVVLGLGSSSPAVVQDWSGVPLERPVQRMHDAVALLRPLLAGEKVTAQRETLRITNFRLGRPSEPPVPIYVAALRPRMVALAGKVGDGVILNLLTAAEVPPIVAAARAAAQAVGRDPAALKIACRIFLCPTRHHAEGDEVARRFLAGYLTAPTYTAFQNWLGHGAALQPALDAWAAGDRRRAVRELPQALVDEWVYVGPPEACREKALAYCANGIDIPILQLFRADSDPVDNTYALRALAPLP